MKRKTNKTKEEAWSQTTHAPDGEQPGPEASDTSGQSVPKSKFRKKSQQEQAAVAKLRMESQGEKLEQAREKLAKQKPPKKPGPVKRIGRVASGSVHSFVHEAFGVTYDAEKDQWYFNGEEVRYFRDVLTSNGESLTSGKFRGEMRTLGSGVGTIDIYTVRDYGHLNSEHHGTLTGIEKYSQEEFDEHTQAGMSGNQPIGNASHN